MQIRTIMRPARWIIAPDDTLGRAERIMARHRLRHLLVVDAGALVGLLTQHDVLDVRARSTPDIDWRHVLVRRTMQAVQMTAQLEDTVATSIQRLATSPVDVLPVVEHGILIGQVTATDLLEAERAPRPVAAGPVTAADAMVEPPITVEPTTPLLDAATLMVENQVRHLPVVEDGTIVGMLSDRDIRTVAGDPVRFAQTREGGDARMLNVRDAMTTTPLTVRDDRPLAELANQLADERIGALPVVDAGGRLIGIVSYVDALRALAA